jgi:bifunctional non-homologous end joining protein LigD
MAARENLPVFVPPMLCSAGAPPTGDGWAFEVKWDGMRAQLRVERGKVCLRSRPGRDCGDEFPDVIEAATAIGATVVLDGELVCFGADGKPDFTALRRCLGARARPGRLTTFVVFDMLHLDGLAVRALPYVKRRGLLGQLDVPDQLLVPRCFSAAEAEHLITWTRDEALEGVVAKRLDALYRPGHRSAAWVKHKHRRVERFVITGWMPDGERGRPAYLLARRTAAGLEPAGTVTLGLDRPQHEQLERVLEVLRVDGGRRRRVRRVEPRPEALVSVHGPTRGPVRDPIIKRIVFDPDLTP